MPESFDPNTIEDVPLRTFVIALMNQVEALHSRLRTQAEEIQRLRDENNRLKGEQGKPQIKPAATARQLSSEHERKVAKPHRKRAKQRHQHITREEVLHLDPATLPADAQFKGYHRVIVQDIVLTTETISLRKEKYYSPSLRQTYLAAVPAGYEGQFGPGVKALALTLAYESGLSEPKIRALFDLAGLQMSVGQLSALLTRQYALFHAERQAILEAGLRSSPWQHIDTTTTRIAGTNHHCHVLCNPLYTVYTTVPQRDRLHALDVLRGGAPRTFHLDVSAVNLMCLMGVPARDQRKLAGLPQAQEFNEGALDHSLVHHGAGITAQRRKWIKDALAIAAYHAQDQAGSPIVRALVCDDAPQFHMLTEEVALCWVHDGRHYKKLEPRLAYHRQLLNQFLEQYWDFYRQLVQYRAAPTAADAVRLKQQFDTLFSTVTGYADLDERIRITRQKRNGLLLVLEHPEIPLHNNPAELGARQRVRKRDISFGPRSGVGASAWDTFQTITATARKLGVNVYHYFWNRLCHAKTSAPLADVIADRAQELVLGASWAPPQPRRAWHPVQVQSWHR